MSDSVRQLNASGSALFLEYLERLPQEPTLPPPMHLLVDDQYSEAPGFDAAVERTPAGQAFPNRYDFGRYLVEVLSVVSRSTISLNSGLWNWLALYYFDQLCPVDAAGKRSPRETAVYCLSEKYRHNRYYRHLVRTPWLAVALHPETSRAILIPISAKGAPLAATGEIFEQVASRQAVFRSATVLAAVHKLYFDPASGRPRRGTGGSEGGSPRRLGQILKQFGLTYDLEWGDGDTVMGLLPKEFAPWKARAV